jgi:spore maturation protein CgeB
MGIDVELFDYRAEAFGEDYYLSLTRSRALIGRVVHRAKRLWRPHKMNRYFVDQVLRQKPDIVLVIKGELLFPETIHYVRQKSWAKLVLWFPDSSTFLGPVSIVPSVTNSLKFYEWVLFCDPNHVSPDLLKQINRYETLTFGCYPVVHRSVRLTADEKQKFGIDLCFIGNSHFEGSIRYETIRTILDSFIDIRCWGVDWRNTSVFKEYPASFRNAVYGEDMVKVYNASKIAFNINGDYPYLNVRNFEAPACGICTITSMVEGLENWFVPGQEVVVYTSVQELIEKIKYYLSHDEERESIALAGQRRAHRDHTLQKRFSELLRIVGR